ncbi:MAG: MarR family winged helix-turn-helix transcriptional regulator [Anaeroplasma sp.]
MQDRFENFTFLIIKLSKIIQRIKSIEMKEYGLKSIHVMCLYHLMLNQNGLTSKELVVLTLEDKAAISRALALLSEKNLIYYEPKKYNGLITLTVDGKFLASEIQKKADMALCAGSEEITDEQRNNLYNVLRIIEKNLDKYCKSLEEMNE